MISTTETNIRSSGFTAVCTPQLQTICRTWISFCLGGFQFGDTSLNPGDHVVARSIALGEPVIYVSVNYRLNGTVSSCMMMKMMMMTYFHWGLWSSSWIPRRKGSESCRNWKCRSQRSYASRPRSPYCSMLTGAERFALEWVQSHISAFGGDPNRVTMYETSTCSRVWGILEHLSLILVGVRVQVLCPWVYTLSSMMDILRVSSTERSWCGCCLWTSVEKTRIYFFSYRNPVLPALWKTLRPNNPCSINLWLTLDALDLLTWSPACVLSRSILWWLLSINPLTFSHFQISGGSLVWMVSSLFAILVCLFKKVYM